MQRGSGTWSARLVLALETRLGRGWQAITSANARWSRRRPLVGITDPRWSRRRPLVGITDPRAVVALARRAAPCWLRFHFASVLDFAGLRAVVALSEAMSDRRTRPIPRQCPLCQGASFYKPSRAMGPWPETLGRDHWSGSQFLVVAATR
jgi:hypothetical protein